MNTAPKLQHIEVLRQMRADFSDCIGLKEEVDALDYALSAASTSGSFNASIYKTAKELAAYLESLYEVNGDGSFTGRKWDVAQRAAIAVMGVTPPWIDAKALEVAKRFTKDTETQRRASLQTAISEAMRQIALAPPSGEWVDEDKRDAIDGVLNRLEGWGKAYPIDMFGPITDEEHAWLHNTRPGLFDRISAGMGRHMAEKIAEDIATLRNIATPQSASVDGEEYVGDIPSNGGFTSDEAWQYMEAAWKRVDRLLGSAYQAGIDGVPFDVLAARNTVHAALTTPPPASQERGGDWKAGDRVLWQSSNGTEFPGTIVRRNLVTYDCKLDDGCDAEGFVASRFKPLPPSSPWKCDTIGCGQLNSSWATECGRCEMPRAASPPSSAAECQKCGSNITFGAHDEPGSCAAEQAKPEPVRDYEAETWLAAQPKLEQAQAGEIDEAIEWLENLNNVNVANRKQAIALLRRLASGVTVDDAMRERFKVAFHSRPNETRTYDEALHDALVAALEAK